MGVNFLDSTRINVCHNNRTRHYNIFAALAEWGKNSMGFYFGFKLHSVIHARGEILNFQVTPANVDDRPCCPGTHGIDYRKFFGR